MDYLNTIISIGVNAGLVIILGGVIWKMITNKIDKTESEQSKMRDKCSLNMGTLYSTLRTDYTTKRESDSVIQRLDRIEGLLIQILQNGKRKDL